jgi:GNAT superfamily N-acetyltransferase
MSDITVRPLGVEEWEQYRSVRLTALAESPEAFVATHAAEESEPEEFWRDRMERSTRLLAEVDGEPVGIASVGEVGEQKPEAAQLFGLFVRPEARGSGVATALVRAGAKVAAEQGRSQLYYWVGTDNGRAVAFASGFGFRPTGLRRPMRVVSEDDGEEEVAMTLPLSGDRGGIPNF